MMGEPLTAEELEVVAMLCAGKDRLHIALDLHLGERTVDHRIAAVKKKLQVKTTAEMAYKIGTNKLLER